MTLYTWCNFDIEFKLPPPHTPIRDENGTITAATDWLGNTFRVGQRVLYAIHDGDSQQMALGTVIKIVSEGDRQVYGFRLAEAGEEADFVNEINDEKHHWVRVPQTTENLAVSVKTEQTSNTWDNRKRTRATWVKSSNITAFPNLA